MTYICINIVLFTSTCFCPFRSLHVLGVLIDPAVFLIRGSVVQNQMIWATMFCQQNHLCSWLERPSPTNRPLSKIQQKHSKIHPHPSKCGGRFHAIMFFETRKCLFSDECVSSITRSDCFKVILLGTGVADHTRIWVGRMPKRLVRKASISIHDGR